MTTTNNQDKEPLAGEGENREATPKEYHAAQIQTLGAVINQAIANHTRGTAITYAELVGTLEMVKADFIDQAKISQPTPDNADD